ncbi:MAG: hypothetical protein IH905_00550 [Proteobacteria bacterium]|nr:hypothetical protein [Pseudomonadota bacterium]
MKSPSSDALESGVSHIDIIMSDYVMPEVDGGMFLRWVRLNEKSPDPFVCFIMMSGAADPALIPIERKARFSMLMHCGSSSTTMIRNRSRLNSLGIFCIMGPETETGAGKSGAASVRSWKSLSFKP